jgi:hypothetical protein
MDEVVMKKTQKNRTPSDASQVNFLARRLFTQARIAKQHCARYARTGVAGSLIALIGFSDVGAAFAQEAARPPSPGHYIQLSYVQLDELVAPIALYPDALVAQVLAASTYPNQVAEAGRFVQTNLALPLQDRAHLADERPWDPGVKALTAFPTVLETMTRNMQWTEQLGNAYYNQPQDVMAAVQRLRERAYQAGTLRSTPQLNVGYQPGFVVIQPVSPSIVYVPTYNPWLVYGAPIPAHPAYAYVAPPPGTVVTAAVIGFTAGVAISALEHYSWGCPHWAPNWATHTVVFNNVTYVSRSVTVINHGNYGWYDHSPNARAFNREVVVGPHGGVATRTFVGGPAGTNVRVTGPQGGVYDRASYAGGSTATVTNANGQTTTRTTQTIPGGNSTTVTGSDGQISTRTVTGRGTGDVNATTTGANGGTIKRQTTTGPNGGSSTITATSPTGKTWTRTRPVHRSH